MTKQSLLSRVCTACGIEKPLSAFLYLTSQGTTYGSICATCRGKGIKEKAQKFVSEDERSSTTSGMRIGIKQLVEIELHKKQEKEERKTRQEEDLKKREQVSSEKIESIDQKEKAEKFHRETYIDEKKKQGFLNYQTKKQTFGAQSVIGQKKDESFIKSPMTSEKQRALEAANVTEAIKQEKLKTTVDLSSGSPVFEQPHHITREATLKRLESLFSGDAPLLKALSQFYKNLEADKQKNISPSHFAEYKKTEKETPQEFIEKTWGPSSRKR